jgi:hypothetical protein
MGTTLDGRLRRVQNDQKASPPTTVWVFHGDAARFASGVFASREQGLAWVAQHQLTGILSQYPLGEGCYDWALTRDRFRPTKAHHGSPGHIAGFSPGLAHVHVADGTAD